MDSMDMSLSELQELVMDSEACVLQFMGLQRVGHDWANELAELKGNKTNRFASTQCINHRNYAKKTNKQTKNTSTGYLEKNSHDFGN